MLHSGTVLNFNRLINQVFGGGGTPVLRPIDSQRAGDHVVVRFDLPGADADSLDVTAENNMLMLRAARRRDTETPRQDSATLYRGRLAIEDGLNLAAAKADYRDGVLTLTVPVAGKALRDSE